MEIKDYRKGLKARFLEKKKKNENYSLRAFARDLNLSVTVLHGVLSEDRHLSKKNLEVLASKLGWSDQEIQTAKKSKQDSADPTQRILFEDEFHLISDWKHLAVLNLAKIKNITPAAVPERLALSIEESKEILDRLCRLGFLVISQGFLKRQLKPFGTSQDIPSRAIRAFHFKNLEKAQESIESVPVEKRDFLTIAAATDGAKVKIVKQMVQEFRKTVLKTLESDKPDQVYFLNLQLYPITTPQKTGDSQ